MKTAVDTNILLDLFLPDPQFGPHSKKILEETYQTGSLIICDIVYSELACHFPSRELLDEALADIQVKFTPLNEEASYLAGQVFKNYRKRGGIRERVLADFLIAAHAVHFADSLLTRDRGFYRTYFPKLKLIEP